MSTSLDTENGTLTMTISGDLTSTTAGPLRADLAKLFAEKSASPWRIFRLDLSTAKMVDSVGLNFIVTILKAVQETKGKLEIVHGNPNVHRTLLFTRLDRHATLVDGGTRQ
jgi:anti-anti-sigma factor